MIPVVAAEPPPGWPAAKIAPPKIAQNAGVELTSFRANHAGSSDARPDGALLGQDALVSGCVAVGLPGWVEDMRPAVEGRTTALAGAAAEKITRIPMDARPDGAGGFDLRPASDLGGPPIGKARTFIGFDSSRVFSCFVTCTFENRTTFQPGDTSHAPAPPERSLSCEDAVRDARLEGSMAPPEPGTGLRGVTWAVHHPRPTAFAGAAMVVVVGVLAVILRRRPRSA
jgi:hypothetical protein